MRDRFTVMIGVVVALCGVVWMVGMAADVDVPWEWVLPGALVALGLLLLLPGSDGGGGTGKPPSQFERDDAPRVP